MMEHYIWLVPLGFVVGAYGTVIGAGGGFVLMPILLLVYPGEKPDFLTSISLAVVFFNALSGSVAYAQMRRIDYESGLLFSTATVPGAILGALSTAFVPRRPFDAIFGVLMVGMAAFLLFRPITGGGPRGSYSPGHKTRRVLVDAKGTRHSFSYNLRLGLVLSFFAGYFSSLLGIGGGIIHVPVLARLLNFPVHIATATSHFMLAIMALAGTIVHIATGSFTHGAARTVALAIGVLLGAQLGAHLSTRLKSEWIIRSLAIALGFVGLRILFAAL